MMSNYPLRKCLQDVGEELTLLSSKCIGEVRGGERERDLVCVGGGEGEFNSLAMLQFVVAVAIDCYHVLDDESHSNIPVHF